jgi:hypothetical protein
MYLLEVLQSQVGDGVGVGLALGEALREGRGPGRRVPGLDGSRQRGVGERRGDGADAAAAAVVLRQDLSMDTKHTRSQASQQ